MQDSLICVGGPLQGRSFTEPPAGYSRTVITRGSHQGDCAVWEYNGTSCLDELLAAAVRYGKFRDPRQRAEGINELAWAVEHYRNPEAFDACVDNQPFGRLPE